MTRRTLLTIACIALLSFGCIPSRNSVGFNEGGSDGGGTMPDGGSTDGGGSHGDTSGGGGDVGGGMDTGGGGMDTGGGDTGPCTPETLDAFCGRFNAECGTVQQMDNCGNQRTAICGMCTGGEVCRPSHTCEMCQQVSTQQFCQDNDAECGQVTAADNCVNDRTEDCGQCGAGEDCSMNTCVESNCRDNADNDNDNMIDCADPDCLGQRCRFRGNRTCQADGSCQ